MGFRSWRSYATDYLDDYRVMSYAGQSFDVAIALMAGVERKGGTTVDNRGETYQGDGYVIGGGAPTLTLPLSARYNTLDTAQRIVDWIERHPAPYYGSWLDKERGVIDIDAVDILQNEYDAMRLGRMRGQKCVWNLAANCGFDPVAYFIGQESAQPTLATR